MRHQKYVNILDEKIMKTASLFESDHQKVNPQDMVNKCMTQLMLKHD